MTSQANARPYTWQDHDADPEQGGDVETCAPTATPSSTLARRLDIANAMCAHMEANQSIAHRITGRVWQGRTGIVRIYTSVQSWVQIDADPTGEITCSDRVGHDRGSESALFSAWEAVD